MIGCINRHRQAAVQLAPDTFRNTSLATQVSLTTHRLLRANPYLMDFFGNLVANLGVLLEKRIHVVLPFLLVFDGALAMVPVVKLCDIRNVHLWQLGLCCGYLRLRRRRHRYRRRRRRLAATQAQHSPRRRQTRPVYAAERLRKYRPLLQVKERSYTAWEGRIKTWPHHRAWVKMCLTCAAAANATRTPTIFRRRMALVANGGALMSRFHLPLGAK